MENKVLAIVDGREVTEADLNAMMKNLGDNASYFQGEDGRKRIINELVMHELIYSDALEQNMDKEEEFITAMETMKKSMLQQYRLSKLMGSLTVSEDEIKEYYEKNRKFFQTKEMVRASHILVDTEEKANEILEDITDGLNFEDAAKQYSSCPSKQAGGDLGQFDRGKMVPEFEEAAFSMKVGEISAPVKTQFGYHIIKLTDHIPAKNASFEEVKEEIRNNCMIAKQDKLYNETSEELKQKYKVEIL